MLCVLLILNGKGWSEISVSEGTSIKIVEYLLSLEVFSVVMGSNLQFTVVI